MDDIQIFQKKYFYYLVDTQNDKVLKKGDQRSGKIRVYFGGEDMIKKVGDRYFLTYIENRDIESDIIKGEEIRYEMNPMTKEEFIDSDPGEEVVEEFLKIISVDNILKDL